MDSVTAQTMKQRDFSPLGVTHTQRHIIRISKQQSLKNQGPELKKIDLRREF